MISEIIASTDWSYLAEGNKNLILSLPQFRSVLRIFKAIDMNQSETVAKTTFTFYNQVIKPLIRDYTYDYIGTVLLTLDDVKRINARCDPDRPNNRKHKVTTCGLALLLPNFTLMPVVYSNEPVYTIELKLKQGYVHPGNYLNGKCVFCYTQYYKLKMKSIDAISEYCPIRMCSGDRRVMLETFKAMIDNPQNNLRVFKDGRIVLSNEKNELNSERLYGAEFGGEKFETFFQLMVEVLLCDFMNSKTECLERNESNCTIESNSTIGKTCEFTSCLPRGSILGTIHTTLKDNAQNLNEMKVLLGKIRKKYPHECVDDWSILKINELLEQCDEDTQVELETLKKHLLFMTIGDSSIIISVQKISPESNSSMYFQNATDRMDRLKSHLGLTDFTFEEKLNLRWMKFRGCEFLVSINVADLDSKFLMIVDKHVKQKMESAACIEKMV